MIQFDLPKGGRLVTLQDITDCIITLPKAEQNLDEWQTAVPDRGREGRDFLLHARRYAQGGSTRSKSMSPTGLKLTDRCSILNAERE
jgi:hypothetical protein